MTVTFCFQMLGRLSCRVLRYVEVGYLRGNMRTAVFPFGSCFAIIIIRVFVSFVHFASWVNQTHTAPGLKVVYIERVKFSHNAFIMSDFASLLFLSRVV